MTTADDSVTHPEPETINAELLAALKLCYALLVRTAHPGAFDSVSNAELATLWITASKAAKAAIAHAEGQS